MARTIGFIDNSGLTWRIFDENGGCISQKYFQKGAQLVGQTATSYSVKLGPNVYVYDANSSQLSQRYVG